VRAAPDVHDCLVPSMLLQPLVENAVRHGALASRGRGRVTVAAERAPGGRLVVRVHDDGPGAAPGVEPLSAGTGLSATARRLRLLYGDAHALHAGPAPEGGFEVRVVIPARAAGGPAGARAGVPGVPDAVSA
jgi:LytS/YehU family sensor histidine kinase